ncbi:MAG: sigma-54 dependent transcriptional regulator [Gemmatimonadetes bacterium]|nr:sigma-54 dependent transcriptional regulator [Gemmatimonadota bacterium]
MTAPTAGAGGARILVVDDEPGIRQALRQLLEYEGYEVRTAAGGMEAIGTYASFRPSVVFLDVKMAGIDGLETLSRLRQADPDATVVMISGHATLQMAVEATRRGAHDLLEKPLDTDRVLVQLRNALGARTLAEENARLREAIGARYAIVGGSPGIQALQDRIRRVAATNARVLITGENGTGKELVARAIHRGSLRADGPFVEVNCAAIPGELIESELFGHVRGSFTGAVADRRGKFEQAHGGTLFLDEVGDMAPAAQAKVLRVLQDGVLTPIGGDRTVQVDVRVLAATNKDLPAEIAAGRFREDLYYRLNVVPLVVPPLRERREDIPALVEHFLHQGAARDGLPRRAITPGAVQALATRDWPGNVRELRNTVERLLILASGVAVEAEDVARLAAGPPGEPVGLDMLLACATFEEFRQAAERAFLQAKLRAHDWNVAETARALDMPRSNLYKKLERYALMREPQEEGTP